MVSITAHRVRVLPSYQRDAGPPGRGGVQAIPPRGVGVRGPAPSRLPITGGRGALGAGLPWPSSRAPVSLACLPAGPELSLWFWACSLVWWAVLPPGEASRSLVPSVAPQFGMCVRGWGGEQVRPAGRSPVGQPPVCLPLRAARSLQVAGLQPRLLRGPQPSPRRSHWAWCDCGHRLTPTRVPPQPGQRPTRGLSVARGHAVTLAVTTDGAFLPSCPRQLLPGSLLREEGGPSRHLFISARLLPQRFVSGMGQEERVESCTAGTGGLGRLAPQGLPPGPALRRPPPPVGPPDGPRHAAPSRAGHVAPPPPPSHSPRASALPRGLDA